MKCLHFKVKRLIPSGSEFIALQSAKRNEPLTFHRLFTGRRLRVVIHTALARLYDLHLYWRGESEAWCSGCGLDRRISWHIGSIRNVSGLQNSAVFKFLASDPMTLPRSRSRLGSRPTISEQLLSRDTTTRERIKWSVEEISTNVCVSRNLPWKMWCNNYHLCSRLKLFPGISL